MNDQRRQQLHDRQHANPEHHFFHQIAVFNNAVGGTGDGVGDKKPRDDAGDQPENEGDIADRSGLEADLKDEPEDQDGDSRLNKRPQQSKVRTQIAGFEITRC